MTTAGPSRTSLNLLHRQSPHDTTKMHINHFDNSEVIRVHITIRCTKQDDIKLIAILAWCIMRANGLVVLSDKITKITESKTLNTCENALDLACNEHELILLQLMFRVPVTTDYATGATMTMPALELYADTVVGTVDVSSTDGVIVKLHPGYDFNVHLNSICALETIGAVIYKDYV